MAGWSADERFDALVVRHADSLLRLAIMLTGNRHDAEDVVQDALIAVAERWDAASPKSGFAYLKRAVSNRAIDIIRKRHDIVTDTLPDSAIDDPRLLRFEDDRVFFALLARLPIRQRETSVVVLDAVAGGAWAAGAPYPSSATTVTFIDLPGADSATRVCVRGGSCMYDVVLGENLAQVSVDEYGDGRLPAATLAAVARSISQGLAKEY